MNRACIVGAGVSGLALAYELERHGQSAIVLEGSDRIGGVIRSERSDGYLFEYAANSVLADADFLKFVDHIGLTDQIAWPPPETKRKFLAHVLPDGRLQLAPAPTGPLKLLRSPLLTRSGKLRAFREILTRPTKLADESAYDFVARHLGPEISERFAGAALAGIWAGDPKRLSARTVLPRIWELDQKHGSLVRGFLSAENRARTKRKKTISFSEGMHQLPATIAARLKTSSVQLNTRVHSIRPTSTGWAVGYQYENQRQEHTFDQVALAIDGEQSAELLQEVEPRIAAAARTVPYAPVGILHVSIPKGSTKQSLDGFGTLIAPVYERALLGVLFSSSVFPNRAPDDRTLLTCFAGGALHPGNADVRKPDVQNRLVNELDEILGFGAEPVIHRATYIPKAIPNYPVGHHELQQLVSTLSAAHPGLYIAASWNAQTSVAGRISEVKSVAERMSTEKPQAERRRAGL